MTVTALDIIGRGRADVPILGLNRPTREALAIYVARRWPVGRRKAIEAEWNLTPDQARSVIEGNPSPRTLDDVWRAGGWGVILAVLGAVVGHGVGEYFAQEAERARREIERAKEIEAACGSAARLARRSFGAPVAPGEPCGADHGPDPLVALALPEGASLDLGNDPGRAANQALTAAAIAPRKGR